MAKYFKSFIQNLPNLFLMMFSGFSVNIVVNGIAGENASIVTSIIIGLFAFGMQKNSDKIKLLEAKLDKYESSKPENKSK